MQSQSLDNYQSAIDEKRDGPSPRKLDPEVDDKSGPGTGLSGVLDTVHSRHNIVSVSLFSRPSGGVCCFLGEHALSPSSQPP